MELVGRGEAIEARGRRGRAVYPAKSAQRLSLTAALARGGGVVPFFFSFSCFDVQLSGNGVGASSCCRKNLRSRRDAT